MPNGHVIGIFQTLLLLHLNKKDGNKVQTSVVHGYWPLPASLLGSQASTLGGCQSHDIAFCQRTSTAAVYLYPFRCRERGVSPTPVKPRRLALADNHFDCVTALSVWTHLNESDADLLFSRDRPSSPAGWQSDRYRILLG